MGAVFYLYSHEILMYFFSKNRKMNQQFVL